MAKTIRKQCLSSQSRELVAKIYDFLKTDATEILLLVGEPQYKIHPVLQSKLSDHLNIVRKRTAKAVGVSERTITNILSERKKNDGVFKSPHKNRKKRRNKLELNNDNIEVIRSTIQNYQEHNNKLPTLPILKQIFQEKLNYDGGLSTLRTVLLKLGYRGRKINDKKKE